MKQQHILKSTGQHIHPLKWVGLDAKPWPENYDRFLIPNPKGKAHIQIIHRTNVEVKTVNEDLKFAKVVSL